jgi:hypothetical protein
MAASGIGKDQSCINSSNSILNISRLFCIQKPNYSNQAYGLQNRILQIVFVALEAGHFKTDWTF